MSVWRPLFIKCIILDHKLQRMLNDSKIAQDPYTKQLWVMICCSFCPYTLECWVFKTAHWIFKTGFYPCNGDEKLKKGENGGNLTLCWSANLELVANLLGSQSIWGNQMGGPEIRILERDRPKLDQISWNRNLNWRNSSSEAVLRKKVLQTKNQCVPWFDQWVSSSTEGLWLIQYLD